MAYKDTQPVADSDVVTIAINTAISNSIDLVGSSLQGVLMPAGWDTATLCFLGSIDNVHFFPVFDTSGNEISYTVAAGHIIKLSTYDWRWCRYLQVASGPSSARVNQTAARVITLLLRLGA